MTNQKSVWVLTQLKDFSHRTINLNRLYDNKECLFTLSACFGTSDPADACPLCAASYSVKNTDVCKQKGTVSAENNEWHTSMLPSGAPGI